MYAEHFGLKMLPFENVPDPVFFFDQGDHARVHTMLTDSLKARRGLIMVTGPIGSGKTTLSQMIISEFAGDTKLIWMAQPPGSSSELFLFIAEELDLKLRSSKATFVLRDIRDALLKINSEAGRCLVIIDESHLISDAIINGIRLLNNLEEGAVKLIQILLLGQDELMDIINRPEMAHFNQRISTRQTLGKMDSDSICEYISHRLAVAGGQASIFTDTGWQALRLTFGTRNTPRLVNLVCDRALTAAFEKEKKTVDVDDVYVAAEEMGLGKEVFHYQIDSKQKKKKRSSVPENKNGATEETDIITAEQESRQPVASHINQIEPEIALPVSPGNNKGLKMPTVFLLISIFVFFLSVAFYCSRSDSTVLLACLLELVGL